MDISILDVVEVLGLPQPADGKRQYNVKCPCCDSNKKDAHLNINIQKNVFNCPRCGVHGGVLSMYCVFTGMDDTKENHAKAYNCIRNKTQSCVVKPKYKPKKIKEYSIADVKTRNKTYKTFLGFLGLSKVHKQNLLNRGLTEEDIVRLNYKSSPMKNCQKLCSLLIEAGCTLEGVPGFWKKAGVWTVGDGKTGILIPFKDVNGNILGIQKRLDTSVEKRKFRWMSSGDLPYGTKTESWIHIVGNPNTRAVILTEGGMKADVINALSGKTVIAVPGVNSIQKLGEVLEDLRANYGVEVIKTAFDMDFISNQFVEKAYNALIDMLKSKGFKYHILVWDNEKKGLDDYLYYKLIECKNGSEN